MLTRDEAIDVLVNKDDAIHDTVSLTGHALFLVILCEAAITAMELNDEMYAQCFSLIQACLNVLNGEQIAVKVFEEFIFVDDDNRRGFLELSTEDPSNEVFWMLLTNTAGWYGALASRQQGTQTYLRDVEDPFSLNRIFCDFRTEPGQVVPWKYGADVFRFVADSFPGTLDDDWCPIDYGQAKVALLRFIGSSGV